MALTALNGLDKYEVARKVLGSLGTAGGPGECPGFLEWSERL